MGLPKENFKSATQNQQERKWINIFKIQSKRLKKDDEHPRVWEERRKANRAIVVKSAAVRPGKNLKDVKQQNHKRDRVCGDKTERNVKERHN